MLRRLVAGALMALALVAVAGSASADAAAKYRNCAAMHKRYPHGVAKSRAAANRQVFVTGRAKVSASLYKANKRLDRDHDGVACESP